MPINLVKNEFDLDRTTRSRKRPNKEALLRVLEKYDGNRTLAANEFDVDRTTLWRWMKRFKI